MPQDDTPIPDGDFQLIFRATPDLYLLLSPQLNIIEVNAAYLQATMVKRDDIIGRALFEVFPDNPDEPEATGTRNLRASLLRVLRDKKPDTMAVQKYDISRPQAQGGGFEERYWSPVNTPVLGSDQEVKYIIHRVEDVTALMQLQNNAAEQLEISKALRSRTGQMEAEVYQRALELQAANEELRKKETDLLHANEELEAFSYSVSHDLLNPIQAISGFSALLMRYCKLNEEEKEYLTEIVKAATNMRELIADLLSFSRVTRSELCRETVDLSTMVQEIIGSLHKLHPDRHIKLTIKKRVRGHCDAHLIRIVFQNLLQNAWKFTAKKGNPEIEFGVEEGEKPIYYIRDNGAGFPSEKAGQLFQPFSRLHQAKDFPGTGVGLATVRRIVERHQGRIWAESRLGQGATFYLQF